MPLKEDNILLSILYYIYQNNTLHIKTYFTLLLQLPYAWLSYYHDIVNLSCESRQIEQYNLRKVRQTAQASVSFRLLSNSFKVTF